MKNSNRNEEIRTKSSSARTYEAPAIIYEGNISTRAGSPLIVPDSGDVDPADLFSE